jgi:putative SOS response-associated peptidase YedK
MMTVSTPADLFGDGPGIGAGPNRPGQVVRFNPRTGQRHLDLLLWGLLPHDTENPHTALRPINARAETVAELPMFVDAWRRRRAIVPAAEWYQRATIGTPGKRHAISRRDGKPLALAGLWESWVSPDEEIVRTYCIITVEANATVAPVHDRMPLVLEEADWPLWLGEVAGDPAALLHPPADDVLVLRPIRGRKAR